MTTFNFTIHGKPQSWDRPQQNGKLRYVSANNVKAKADIAKSFREQVGTPKPIEGPVRLSLSFMYEWPASYTKARQKACYGNMKDTRPDIDNLEKLIMDGLNGIAYQDDGQIAEIHATKFFTHQKPCTRVTIEALWEQAGAE